MRPSSFSTALISTICPQMVAALVLAQDHGRLSQAQIDGMRMVGDAPTRKNRLVWFLEGMLDHHGGALLMAHDALAMGTNPTIRRFARGVIVVQRAEIIELRRMLAADGLL